MTHPAFYPATPCPATNVSSHPAFVAFKAAAASSNENRQEYFRLARFCDRVAENPEKYVNGISLADFTKECESKSDAKALVKELERMRVYEKTNESGKPVRLVPASEKVDRRKSEFKAGVNSFYLHDRFQTKFRAKSDSLGISMGRMIEYAVTEIYDLLHDDQPMRDKILRAAEK